MKPRSLSILVSSIILITASASLKAQTSVKPIPHDGIPSGFSILGDTKEPPVGYTYTGKYMFARGYTESWNARADMPTSRAVPTSSIQNAALSRRA